MVIIVLQAKERLDQLRQTPLGAKMIAEMGEEAISDLNMDEIVAKQIEQLEKEKKELAEKLRTQEKKVKLNSAEFFSI